MNLNSGIDLINQQTMRLSVATYSAYDSLGIPETKALKYVTPHVSGGRILDIGVGGGRTVKALYEISSDYVGIDYVPEMVEACRARFPNINFEQADARCMPQFADASFDLIVFAWAGICMVDHEGRIAILKEIRRLLKADGYFIFSSYNINSPDASAKFYFPEFEPTLNPVKLATQSIGWCRNLIMSVINRIKLHRFEVRTSEYAIINDRCHDYGTMLYYISLVNQYKQLRDANFSKSIVAFDGSGNEITTDSCDGAITYLVKG